MSGAPDPVSKDARIKLDGREIPFEPGQTVIQAAHAAGVEIPHYCWHPGLSIAGNCRICMVEVAGSPKPQVSCKLACTPGLDVKAESDLAKQARAGVMEMLLVNHPLDCPICDQAGECHLQEYSFQFGQGAARATTEKTHLPKNVPFGAKVVYDAERCIKCTLCVRFMDEVAGTHELSMGGRSDHEIVVMTAKGEFSTPYALNIVDICPVGALTSRDFRFKSRLWFMDFTPSVCTGCARGCNVVAGARTGRLLRLEPRENQAVNGFWMCDPGRLDTGFVNSPTRVGAPRVRRGGAWVEVTVEQALARAGELLRGAKGDVLADGNLSLEELLLAQRLAATLSGKARFAAPASAAVLLVERDGNVPAAMRDATGAKVVFASDLAHVPASAEVLFPLPTFVEKDGWIVNVDGRVQALRRSPQAGPQGLAPAVDLLDELCAELSAAHDGQDLAGLRDALRALPGLRGLVWSDVGAAAPAAPAAATGAPA